MTPQPTSTNVPKIDPQKLTQALSSAEYYQQAVRELDRKLDEAHEQGADLKLLEGQMDIFVTERTQAWAQVRTLVFAAAGRFDVGEDQQTFAVVAGDMLVVVHGGERDNMSGPLDWESGWSCIPLSTVVKLEPEDQDQEPEIVFWLPSAN